MLQEINIPFLGVYDTSSTYPSTSISKRVNMCIERKKIKDAFLRTPRDFMHPFFEDNFIGTAYHDTPLEDVVFDVRSYNICLKMLDSFIKEFLYKTQHKEIVDGLIPIDFTQKHKINVNKATGIEYTLDVVQFFNTDYRTYISNLTITFKDKAPSILKKILDGVRDEQKKNTGWNRIPVSNDDDFFKKIPSEKYFINYANKDTFKKFLRGDILKCECAPSPEDIFLRTFYCLISRIINPVINLISHIFYKGFLYDLLLMEDAKREKTYKLFMRYFKCKREHQLSSLLQHGIDLTEDEIKLPYRELKQQISIKEDMHSLDKVKEKIGTVNKSWDSLKCLIPQTKVEYDKISISILDAQDPVQIALGNITECCQKLNAAGEASMMEGLVNDKSGFLVFRSGGVIVAQSWIWESKNGDLVLDNIEFADFKGFKSIGDALKLWCEKSPYKNIQLGTGYLDVTVKSKKVKKRDKHWYAKVWTQQYTDADTRLWLKNNGIVSFDIEDTEKCPFQNAGTTIETEDDLPF